MLQDIEPHRLYNQFVANATPQPNDYVFHFKDEQLLLCGSSVNEHSAHAREAVVQTARTTPGELPRLSSLPQLPRVEQVSSGTELIRLFAIDDTVYWGCDTDTCELASELTGEATSNGAALQALDTAGNLARELAGESACNHSYTHSYASLRSLRSLYPAAKELLFAAYSAYQLLSWYRHNRFCGCCGASTQLASDERAIECPICKNRVYPKVQPAVIVGVIWDNKLLLTKYADRPSSSYALVAGFTEFGETLEQTVEREVMEEVGLKVNNIRYYKSQPWGIASDILAGFYCDVVGTPEIKLDSDELKVAQWFERAAIKGQGNDMSLTAEMMLTFRDGNEPR